MSRKGTGKSSKRRQAKAPDLVLEILREHRDEGGLLQTYISNEIIKLLQREELWNEERDTFKRVYARTRKALSRLKSDGKAVCVKKGRNSLWEIAPIDGLYPRADEHIDYEETAKKLIEKDWTDKPIELHHLSFYINRDNWKQPKSDETEVYPSVISTKKNTRIKDKLLVHNPLDPHSLFQIYNNNTFLCKRKEVKGGFIETFLYGENRTVSIQVTVNNKMNIFCKMTNNPITFYEYGQLVKFIDGILRARVGVTLSELRDFTRLSWEWNHDKRVLQRIDASGKYAITMRTFDTLWRIYTKTIHEEGLDKQYVRREGESPIIDWSEMESLQGLIASMMGGVNSQFLINNHVQMDRRMRNVEDALVKLGNSVEYNQKMLQKLGWPEATKKPKGDEDEPDFKRADKLEET